jgi:hypothetical protein
MHNVQILPRDLVSQEPPKVDNLVLQLHLTIEFKRRRYETINQIIMERNRILARADAAPPRARRVRKRSHRGKEQTVAIQLRMIPSRRRVRERIRQGAQMRLEKVKHDESRFEQRRHELRQAKEIECQRQERLYMRLEERKQRALEEERHWRCENIYRGANLRRKPPPSDLAELADATIRDRDTCLYAKMTVISAKNGR